MIKIISAILSGLLAIAALFFQPIWLAVTAVVVAFSAVGYVIWGAAPGIVRAICGLSLIAQVLWVFSRLRLLHNPFFDLPKHADSSDVWDDFHALILFEAFVLVFPGLLCAYLVFNIPSKFWRDRQTTQTIQTR